MNTNEQWAIIADFPSYEVSSHGQVRHGSKILKPRKNPNGYLHVVLAGQKPRSIHRLVAIAFLPNPKKKRCVNHRDSTRTNNRVDNLEWATHRENAIHAMELGRLKCGQKSAAVKITQQIADEIRFLWISTDLTQEQIAARYGIDRSNVSLVVNNKSWLPLNP